MSAEYTPTTEDIRFAYADRQLFEDSLRNRVESDDSYHAEFDRWHQAEIAAAEKRGAVHQLRVFADELEEHIGDHGPGNRNTGYGRQALDLLGRVRSRANQLEKDS